MRFLTGPHTIDTPARGERKIHQKETHVRVISDVSALFKGRVGSSLVFVSEDRHDMACIGANHTMPPSAALAVAGILMKKAPHTSTW